MSRQVIVRDLHDQIGYNGPRAILYCPVCGQESSANKGDYLTLPGDYVFTCCGFPMARVVKSTVFKHVGAEHI